MIILGLAHLIFCIIALTLLWHRLTDLRYTLYSTTLMGFLVANSVGLGLIPFVDLADIPYLTNSMFLLSFDDTELYFRQIVAHWITISFIMLFSFGLSRQTPKQIAYFPSQKRMKFIITGFYVLGAAVYFRYFITGPGMELLLSTRLDFASVGEAVASRSESRDSITLGIGAYQATLVSRIVFPLIAIFGLFWFKRIHLINYAVCFGLSLAFAIQTRQKAPVVICIVIYLAIITIFKYLKSNSKTMLNLKVIRRMMLASLVVVLLFTALSYKINFGLSWVDSIKSTVARVLIVSVGTETNFFYVFPNEYGFQGIDKIFKIPLGRYGQLSNASIYDVALIATGDRFSSNASFLAVAWSGLGYAGVALITLLVLLTLKWASNLSGQLPPLLFFLNLAFSLQTVVGLSGGGFQDYISWGGLVMPILIYYIYLWTNRLRNEPNKERM